MNHNTSIPLARMNVSFTILRVTHLQEIYMNKLDRPGSEKTKVLSTYGETFYGRIPASILYKSIAGRYRPVSYPDGPITARYRFIKNAY